MSLRRSFLIPGALLALMACDDATGPAHPAEVMIAPDAITLTAVGETVQLAADPHDGGGRSISGHEITWLSRNEGVATVSETGLVTAVAPGQASIRATADGVTGRASVLIDPVVVAFEGVVGNNQSGTPGNELETSPKVVARDVRGNAVRGKTVIFTVVSGGGSVRPGSAVTRDDGSASTRWTLGPDASQPQIMRALYAGLEVEFDAGASENPPLITTANLEQARASLSYAATFEANGGAGPGYEWAIADGALPPGIELSSAGSLTGAPIGVGDYTFTAQVRDGAGVTATRVFDLRVCEAPVDLALGELMSVRPPAYDECGLMLPSGSAGDRYRLSLVRTTESEIPHAATVLFQIRGRGVVPSGSPPAATAGSLGNGMIELDRGLGDAAEVARHTADFHLELRERERALLEHLGPRSRAALPSALSSTAAASQAPPSDRRHFQISFSPFCQAGPPYAAVLVGENAELAIYQDEPQYLSAPVDPVHIQMMLDYYRDYGRPVIDDYFGGMSDINGDGRAVIFISPVVPDGIAAFVWAGDLFSRAECPASNGMELMYFSNQLIHGMGDEDPTYQSLATMVHEAKHISSLKNALDRADDASGFQPVWIEEGTAEIAGELSSRLAWAATGGPALGEQVSGAHVNPTGMMRVTTPENYGVLVRLARTIAFLTSQPNAVTNNPDGSRAQGHTFYGSSWHFHRFLGDAYGSGAETSLFTLQNAVTTPAGVEAYPSLTGHSFSDLLEEFAAAIMLNGMDVTQPERTFTTYDFTTATNIMDPGYQPLGAYPWPVTTNAFGNPSASFDDATYETPLGTAGVQIYDLRSNGTGEGTVINVVAPQPAKLLVTRVR